MSMKEELSKKIDQREIVVGVVGLGYVGLPLAVEKAKAGFKTIGFDVQAEKVKLVNEGHNYIGDVVDTDLKEIVEFANENLLKSDIKKTFFDDLDKDEMIDKLYKKVVKEYEEKISNIPDEVKDEFEKAITLQVVDNYWMEHINTMSHLREGIYLREYGYDGYWLLHQCYKYK